MCRLLTACELSELSAVNDSVAQAVWPKFMLNDPVAGEFWHHLYEEWPDYQFAVLQGDRIVALGNSVPLHWESRLEQLPDEGWDWILPKAVSDRRAGRSGNLQVAIQVMVLPEHQGKGLSAEAVRSMKRIGAEHGHRQLIVPGRPTLKCQHPHTPIEEYLSWRDDQGFPFDSWVRTHVRLGAQVIKVCHHSMEIRGTTEEWRDWTGLSFPESGAYVVPGALVPVIVDTGKALGVYIEPNVWLRHSLANV